MSDVFATLSQELPWLRTLATRLAQGDRDEAEDLVQDTLQVAWERPPPEQALQPRGWLSTVLRNRLRMARRGDARRAQRHDAAALTVQAASDPIDEFARLELVGVLVERLRSLPDLDRQIVSLRFFDELDAATIGVRLAIPHATVRSRLHRALARLRADIDAHYGDRRTWALLLGVPSSVPRATPIGAFAAMTTTAKLGVTLAVVATSSMIWFVGRASEPPNGGQPLPAAETPTAAGVVPVERSTPTPPRPSSPAAATWEARRRTIRDQLAKARPGPSADEGGLDADAAMEQANMAIQAAFEGCIEESGRRIDGTITVRATIIGGSDIGMIVESMDPVGAPRDVELLECATESSYAFLGPAPREPFDFTTTVSWMGAQPKDTDDDAWRREMFDAVMAAHLAELWACADTSPNARGALRLEFEFADGPTPTSVRATGDVDAAVIRCAEVAAATWHFPRKFAGQRMISEHTYPIDSSVFAPDRGDDP